MRLVFALIALPLAASAQDFSHCPVPIQPGNWVSVLTDTVSTVDLFSGDVGMRLTAPLDKSGQPWEAKSSCSADGLTISGVSPDGFSLEFDMDLADWLAPNGPRYTGSTNVMGINIDMAIELQSPIIGIGQTRITAEELGGRLDARPSSVMYYADGEESEHYACGCPEQLDAFLKQRIEMAERTRDAYANPDYRRKPGTLSGFRWTIENYNAVILNIVGQKITHEEAGEKRNNDLLSSVGQADDNAGAGDLIADGTVRVGAWTDSSCKVHDGDANRYGCFPDIQHGEYEVHEAVHVADCEYRRDNNLGEPDFYEAVDQHADEEVDAYSAQIVFLLEWPARNCRG